ncbi:MAG TPA: hypothetical protein VG433_01905 [Pirellulales bacterium]|nr:hypothetical protein [Pirellulales bacterium]
MAFVETHLLAELLGRKHDCLAQLYELGGQQLVLVESGDITQLLKVLAAKQRLLERLQEIEGGLDPFRSQHPDQRQWSSAEERSRCSQVVERSELLFRDILAREKQSEQLLGLRRDDAAARLEQAHTASQARGAYGTSYVRPLGRLDLSSEVA